MEIKIITKFLPLKTNKALRNCARKNFINFHKVPIFFGTDKIEPSHTSFVMTALMGKSYIPYGAADFMMASMTLLR
jgi:hypothetical protein